MDRATLSRLDEEAFLVALQGWLAEPDPGWIPALVATVRGERSLARRTEAARCLAFQAGKGWRPDGHRALNQAIMDLARDRSLWPPARAFAYEGIANRCPAPCPPTVSAVIRMGLEDWDPEVRFWACYAACRARDAQALPVLERLAQQPMVVPMLWSVHLEAQDAIRAIRGAEEPAPAHAIAEVGTWHRMRRARQWTFTPQVLLHELPGVEQIVEVEELGSREILVEIAGELDLSVGWQAVESWQWRGWVSAWGERGMVTLQRSG